MSQTWPAFAGAPVVPVNHQGSPKPHSSLFPIDTSVIYVGVPKSLPMIRYHKEASVSKEMLEQCTPANEDVRVFRNKIRAGSFGVSFEACLQDKCDYVAKLVKLANKEEKHAFRMECELAKHASLHGFGPIVRRVSLCEPAPDNDETEMFGIIIMEKLRRTLNFYRRKYEVTESDCDSILEAMAKMHDAGIWHSDLHDQNIMQRFDGSFVIIDFGMSWPLFTSVPLLLRCADLASWAYPRLRYDGKETNNTTVIGEGLSGGLLSYCFRRMAKRAGLSSKEFGAVMQKASDMRVLDRSQFDLVDPKHLQNGGPMASADLYFFAADALNPEAIRKLGTILFLDRCNYSDFDLRYTSDDFNLMMLTRLQQRAAISKSKTNTYKDDDEEEG